MSQLIVVFGATGRQGESVVRALLANGYKVRALTRNPDSTGGKSLQEKGCEVVKVDLDDASSVQSSVAGAHGVFAVTNFWALLAESENKGEVAMAREVAQGKTIGDACKKEGVKHLVYSGLASVEKSIGKSCPHLDGKAIVEEYLDEIGVPATSTRLPFYYENFYDFVQKGDDGTFSITFPMDGPMDALSVADIGEIVVTVFKSADKYIGKKLNLSGDKKTMGEYAAIVSEVTGKTLTYNKVPAEVFSKFPFPGAEELAVMFEFFSSDKFTPDQELTRILNPSTTHFKQWAEKNKDKLLA